MQNQPILSVIETQQLQPFQLQTINWLNQRRYGLVLNQAGTGKTLTMLKFIEQTPTQTVLVICPTGVMNTWLDEYSKFGIKCNSSPELYYGAQRNNKQYNNFVITSFNTFNRSVIREPEKQPRLNALFNRVWDHIIIDEGHYIRNSQNAIAQSVWLLKANKRWILTATPMFNKVHDSFSYFKFFGLVDSKNDWKTQMQVTDDAQGILQLKQLYYNHSIRFKKCNVIKELPIAEHLLVNLKQSDTEQELYSALQNYSYDRIKLLTVKYKTLIQNANMQRIYGIMILVLILRLKQCATSPYLAIFGMKRMKELNICNPQEALKKLQFFNNQQQKDDEECPICYDASANYISECGHKCCKSCWDLMEKSANYRCPICNQFVDFTSLQSVVNAIPPIKRSVKVKDMKSTKTDWIVNKMKQVSKDGEKLVIASQWVQSLKLLRAIAEEEKVLTKDNHIVLKGGQSIQEKRELIHKFQTDSSVKYCLLSMLSSAEGITLTAANNMIIVDPWWNRSKEIQTRERIHRIGQTKQVRVYYVKIQDTIEMNIELLQTKKEKLSQMVLGDIPVEDSAAEDSWIKRVIKLVNK